MQIIIILETFKDFFSCKLSWPQVIIILKIVKIFLACKIVLDANNHYPEIIQSFFSLAKLSEAQIIIILETFKDFFAGKIVLGANLHSPGNIQRLFLLQIVLAASHHYLENSQKFSRLESCLRRKSSLSWNLSKIFSLAKLS